MNTGTINGRKPETKPNSQLKTYTVERLDELRRFRRFKGYYCRLDYDWDKLDFVVKKLSEVHTRLHENLLEFVFFLKSLG